MLLEAKDILRIMLSRAKIKQKDLVILLTERTGKKYSSGSLSQKVRRGTISYNEITIIADILGFSIKLDQK